MDAPADAEGGLWVAEVGDWHIRSYAPNGRLDREIRMPFQKPTSVMFGGAGLDTFYVTSMRFGLTDAALAEQPLAGSLLQLDVGVKGLPEHCSGVEDERHGRVEVTRDYLARGWSAFTDPGFISHAGPFFHRMEVGPSFAFHLRQTREPQRRAAGRRVDDVHGSRARSHGASPDRRGHDGYGNADGPVHRCGTIGETVHVTPTMARATKQLIFMNGTFMVESRIVAVVSGVWKKILKG